MRAIRFMACVLAAAVGPVLAQDGRGAISLLAQAETAMSAAASLRVDQPAEAQAAFVDAAAKYHRLINEFGVRNARVYRSLGNARLLSGDVGRAVLNYRRAASLDPRDERTSASLAYARSQVRTEVVPGVSSRLARDMLWWRGVLPRPVLWWAVIAGSTVFWGVLIIRLGRLQPSRLLAAGSAGIALLAMTALTSEVLLDDTSNQAVVVAYEAVGYNGPSSEVYQPTLGEPLRGGVEARIIERRDGWVRLELTNGQQTWLMQTAIETVAHAD